LVSPVLARWTPAPIRARRRRRRAASMAAAPATPRWISPQLARLLPGEASMDDHDLRRWPSRAAAERYQSIFTELHLRSVVDSGRLHARFHQTFADPWSDRRIAEFAVAIPQRVLNTGFEDKRLTRRVVVGMIPDAARLAMRKTVPLPLYDRGIRERARETIEELLSDSELARRGWVDDRTLRDHYRAIVAGGRDDGYLWYTLSLELWLRAFWPSYAPTLLATGGGAT